MTLAVTDRKTADAAASLVASHGCHAADEAASRANVSRDRGNVINFCHWRQVERVIGLLSAERGEATLH